MVLEKILDRARCLVRGDHVDILVLVHIEIDKGVDV
jgi:hypothetical protein